MAKNSNRCDSVSASGVRCDLTPNHPSRHRHKNRSGWVEWDNQAEQPENSITACSILVHNLFVIPMRFWLAGEFVRFLHLEHPEAWNDNSKHILEAIFYNVNSRYERAGVGSD